MVRPKHRLLLSALLLACLGLALACPRHEEPDEEDEVHPFVVDGKVVGALVTPPLPDLDFAGGAPSLSFFALGDTGWGGVPLADNAAAMERSAAQRPVDLVLLLGDNFYRSGADSLADVRWHTEFESAFSGPHLQVPFYAVLGNHDHHGDPDVEIEYTKHSTRWRMPARWYTFVRELPGGGEVQFFALDTQAVHKGESFAGLRLQSWLEDELKKSKARWKIVFGHHPALSNGVHGGTDELVEDIAPLFEEYGVDLYLSGHDHDLQILKSSAGWLQVVSGTGSSTRDTSYGPGTLFATASVGYAWVGIDAHEMWVEIATARDGPQFRWKVEKSE